MIVLRGPGTPTGILVGSVRGIVSVVSTRLLDLPVDGTFEGCATATFDLDGELIHLLSVGSLLEANEVRLLAEYGAMAQERMLHLAATIEGRE